MESSQNRIARRPYGVISGYFFASFGIVGISGILSALLISKKANISTIDHNRMFVGLVIGIPCLIIAVLIMHYVLKKAKRNGYGNVAGQFITYSAILIAKLLVIFSVILIPIFKFIFRSPWEERIIAGTFGEKKKITVRYIGSGKYEDIYGNVYEED